MYYTLTVNMSEYLQKNMGDWGRATSDCGGEQKQMNEKVCS